MDEKTAFFRSDLACERRDGTVLSKEPEERIRRTNGIPITEAVIRADSGYPEGRYMTVDIGKIWLEGDEHRERCSAAITEVLNGFIDSLTGSRPSEKLCILVAGLGNRFITADALGPLTVDRLTVTRHMMGNGGIFDSIGCSKLCAVMPGVLGQTGIEAAAVIRGAADESKPDVVIAVDALAARSTARLATTVQITDSGLYPGSGIGNRRVAINKDTIGRPVISVGVPTVVDSRTLVWDALEQAGVDEISHALRNVLENGKGFFVSPGESDVIVRELAELLGDAIERTAGV